MDVCRAVFVISIATAVLSGCAVGGVASVTYYEPAVPDPAPERMSTEKGMTRESYSARLGLHDPETFSFAREGILSITLQYPQYDLRVFTTQGQHTGGAALGLFFYLPVPLPAGPRHRGAYVVRAELTCRDEAGCTAEPLQAKLVAGGEAVSTGCVGTPNRAEVRADAEGKWRLAPHEGITIACSLSPTSPELPAITLDLSDAIVVGDGKVRVAGVVLRRQVAHDGYHLGR